MDRVAELEDALGAELLRARLLRRPLPRLANRYVVESVLGRGAGGVVLAATDERLARPVALKLRPVDGDSAMLAEARALARLDHPNVVRVHDVTLATLPVGDHELRVWLVSMARVEGVTMRAWLREARRSPSEIARVLADVARGLAAAHASGFVHRDVKPENIVVRADGVAQVLDFGLAVPTSTASESAAPHVPAAGTDPYIPPEARIGRASRRGDQFALGVTLVEALTGVPLPASQRGPLDVPTALWTIARTATAPTPEERYRDMNALCEALSAIRDPASAGAYLAPVEPPKDADARLARPRPSRLRAATRLFLLAAVALYWAPRFLSYDFHALGERAQARVRDLTGRVDAESTPPPVVTERAASHDAAIEPAIELVAAQVTPALEPVNREHRPCERRSAQVEFGAAHGRFRVGIDPHEVSATRTDLDDTLEIVEHHFDEARCSLTVTMLGEYVRRRGRRVRRDIRYELSLDLESAPNGSLQVRGHPRLRLSP